MVDAGNIETSESSSLTPTTVRNFGLSDSKSVYFEVKVRDTNRGLLRISIKIKLKTMQRTKSKNCYIVDNK